MGIRIRHLVFGHKSDEPLIEIETLDLNAAEPTALVGANGSGKTTLLRLIHGLLVPQQGVIEGVTNKHSALIFQRPRFLRVSVRHNLIAAGVATGMSWKKASDCAAGWLEKTGLYSHADRPALALSGGQQKRLAVARALLKSPEVLLADEVTAHLDAKQGALVEQLLGEHIHNDAQRTRPTKTLIFASHDPAQVERLARRVIYLNRGRIERDERVS